MGATLSSFNYKHIISSSVITDAIVAATLTLLGAVIAGFKRKVTFLVDRHTKTEPVAACSSSTPVHGSHNLTNPAASPAKQFVSYEYDENSPWFL